MTVSVIGFAPTIGQIKEQVMMKLRLEPADGELVLYWINQAYADAAQFSSFNQAQITIGMTGGESVVPLPTEVQMVRQVLRCGEPAQKVRVEDVQARLARNGTAGTESGGVYSIGGQAPNELLICPVAGSDEQIVVVYSTVPGQVFDTDRPMIAEPFGSKILEYGALVEGAKFKKDPMVYDYEQTHALWVDRYIGWLNRRKTANSTAFTVWTGTEKIDRLEAESEHYGVPGPA